MGQSPTSEAQPNERNEPRLRRQSGEFVELFIDGGDNVKAITFHTRNVDIIL